MRALLLAGAIILAACSSSPPTWPGSQPDGRILLTNGWWLDPHGEQIELPSDLPVRMCVHPEQRFVAVQHAGYRDHMVAVFDATTRSIVARAKLPRSWSGMCWSRDGAELFVSGGTDDEVRVYPFDAKSGALGAPRIWPVGSAAAFDLPAGMCTGREGSLWVCLQRTHRLLQLDREGTETRSVELPADSFPFEVATSNDDARLFVSLWNHAEIWTIDVASGEVLAHIATGQHPSEMLVHPDGKRLFVSNGNENSVSVVDLRQAKTIETISSALFPGALPGSTPNSLALVGDDTLLVANADNNDCALIDVGQLGHSRGLGFVPVGRYPTSVRALRGGFVLVANGKGSVGSHANPDGPTPEKPPKRLTDYTGALYSGSLSVFSFPSPDERERLSLRAMHCAPLRSDGGVRELALRPADSPIPSRPGGESPMRYVVYVIKENRTYDQVFGDLPQGNGDASLCLFPRDVTPNAHAIAEDFVLLDNFYVESEVSADGHEWSMGAYASDFVQRTWPVGYSDKGKQRTPEGSTVELGYPSEGNFTLAAPKNGYLWDLAAAAGVTYRSYGEFVANPGESGAAMHARVPALAGHFCTDYRSFDLAYPDGRRVDAFLAELREFEKRGELPRLCIVRLPQDHTAGTKYGEFTPRSCVAENDLALGRLLDALSQSRFWPEMVVFVVEDDAQNGPDHVDAHRSIGLVAGPFVKRGAVVHSLYSTCSMLRTMELILGLPPMSQFDAAAMPMFDCFEGAPNAAPYSALTNRVPIDARNGVMAWGSEMSERFDLSTEDAVDDLLLNEVVWRSIKGADSPMPAPVHAAFVRAFDSDDDD
jgi:DNA-binding beta-propeller fold protein YncE